MAGKGLRFSLAFGDLCCSWLLPGETSALEFPQPSADFLPSGLGEISLRRHQKLVSTKNPDSVAITHPLGCTTPLRNARGGAWRGGFTWGVHVSTGWDTQRGPG